MIRRSILALSLVGCAVPGLAETPPAPAPAAAPATAPSPTPSPTPSPATAATGAKTPLQVSADNGVEWQKDTKLYIARGNAVATRGDLRVRADVLTAHYRDATAGKTEIFRVDAVGGVVLKQGDGTATGGQAIYDVDNRILRLSGGNLTYTTNDSKITAQDSLEYYDGKRMAVARGSAVAVRGTDQVQADVLTGYFTDANGGTSGNSGKRSLSRIDATGHVVVTSNQNVAHADAGTYDPNTKLATLTGHVHIVRGGDQLLGERAEVNMNTGTYKLLPGAKGGRVTGVILPDQNLDNATPADGSSRPPANGKTPGKTKP